MTRHDADDEGPPPDDVENFEGPAYPREMWRHTGDSARKATPGGSRAEQASNQIARLAAGAQTGDRIGSKDDLRRMCQVSVGTINEAIRLAQARGIITSRPGPGGGLFACNPSPLARMNGWFRAAADDHSAFLETIDIRNAIAPLLVDEVMEQMTLSDEESLTALLNEIRIARDSHATAEFMWACFELHAHFAGIGKKILLDTLYLSVMDVGLSYIRAVVQATSPEVHLGPLTDVMEDLVDALHRRDSPAAVAALCRTDPTMILRGPNGR